MRTSKQYLLRRSVRLGAAALALVVLAGCATTLQQARGGPGQRLDPWESWNRKVFNFNEDLDKYVLKPVATVYQKVVPRFLRTSVDNFFANAKDGWSFVNNVLQGKPTPASEDLVRFMTNSVFGFAGVIDVASDFGLDHHYEDFGQTLGVWGFGAGAYIVWPLLGPSTVRDSIGLPLDRAASPALLINDGAAQFGITTLQIISTRAGLLRATDVLDDIALDKYTFVRDAYLQRRRSLVFDGNEPTSASPAADAVDSAASAASGGRVSVPATPASGAARK